MAFEKDKIIRHPSVSSYIKYWNDEVERCKQTKTAYADWLKSWPRTVNDGLRNDDDFRRNMGLPLPKSYQDAKDRDQYLGQEQFVALYEELKPYLEELAKQSAAIIEDPVMKPNDLEIGNFSIDRAMMAIRAMAGFYSDKYKKFFYLSEGEMYEDPKTKETKYRLKSDKSPLKLTQYEENGEKKWYTDNKKSFLYKTNTDRPLQAVRLYVGIGNNWGTNPVFQGLTGVIVGQFLESKGYKVAITAANIVENWYCKLEDGSRGAAYRINLIEMKKFSDLFDTYTYLLPLADASFFRVRVFEYYVAQMWKFDDTFESGLGRTPQGDQYEKTLRTFMKNKRIETEADTLDFFISGAEVFSKDTAIKKIQDIALTCEQKNKEALEEIRGYQPYKTP